MSIRRMNEYKRQTKLTFKALANKTERLQSEQQVKVKKDYNSQ